MRQRVCKAKVNLHRDIFIDKKDWRTWSILPDVYFEDKHLGVRLTNWSEEKQLFLFPSNLNVSQDKSRIEENKINWFLSDRSLRDLLYSTTKALNTTGTICKEKQKTKKKALKNAWILWRHHATLTHALFTCSRAKGVNIQRSNGTFYTTHLSKATNSYLLFSLLLINAFVNYLVNRKFWYKSLFSPAFTDKMGLVFKITLLNISELDILYCYRDIIIFWGIFFRGLLSQQLATTEQRLNWHLTPTKVWNEGGACPFIAELLV